MSNQWGRRKDTNRPYPKGSVPISNKVSGDIIPPPTLQKQVIDKEFAKEHFREVIYQYVPNDSDIIFFGGIVDKPWPRKDVDVIVVVHDSDWFDELPVQVFGNWEDGSIEDIIFKMNEKFQNRTKIGGDVFLYIEPYNDLYHEDGRDGVINVRDEDKKLYSNIMRELKASRGMEVNE